MKVIGKTYLIECENIEPITNEGGIFVVNNVNVVNDGFWRGIVKGYGNMCTEEEIKDLLPIGTKVVMDVTKKANLKLVLGNHAYYVRNIDEIIGVIEE